MAGKASSALEGAILIVELLRRIPRRSFTTTRQLHEQVKAAGFDVSLRTIQRHLDVICGRFPIECDTRSKPYGYRWMRSGQGLTFQALTPSEALLLTLAYQELAAMLPAHVLRSLAVLFENARSHIELEAASRSERRWMKKVARIPDSQPLLPARIDPAVFEAVSDALYLERELALDYRNARDVRRQATVWPLGLVQQGSRSYLVCRFPGYHNERILALSRIERAEMLASTFPWPTGFDLERYVAEGHFGIKTEQQVRVRFTIEAAVGRHLIESPLSNDQVVRKCGDRLEISATLPETLLLHRWLRGWGETIQDLSIEAIASNV